jgi:hypothetical protein
VGDPVSPITLNTPRHSVNSNKSWLSALLPLSAIPLWLLLIVILPVSLLLAESLFSPFAEFLQSLLMPINNGNPNGTLPLSLLLKMLLFLIFAFTGITMLLLKITCLYYQEWIGFFNRPHPEHADYHPEQQESMIALLNWNLFRLYQVLGPPAMWAGGTVIVTSCLLFLSNLTSDFGFFTFQLEFTLGLFLFLTLSFFTTLSVFKAIWISFCSLLGDVSAITEPEKPSQVLFERTRRLAFLSPWVWLVYPLYAIFWMAVLSETILLLAYFDMTTLWQPGPQWLLILECSAVTLFSFIVLKGLKLMVYHDALARYYAETVVSRKSYS